MVNIADKVFFDISKKQKTTTCRGKRISIKNLNTKLVEPNTRRIQLIVKKEGKVGLYFYLDTVSFYYNVIDLLVESFNE